VVDWNADADRLSADVGERQPVVVRTPRSDAACLAWRSVQAAYFDAAQSNITHDLHVLEADHLRVEALLERRGVGGRLVEGQSEGGRLGSGWSTVLVVGRQRRRREVLGEPRRVVWSGADAERGHGAVVVNDM